jgi:hypothetical protein
MSGVENEEHCRQRCDAMQFVGNVLGVTEVDTNSYLTLFAYFFPVVEGSYT